MGSKRGNKKESIGIYFIFLAIFSGTGQIFGYKILISSFLEILPIGIDQGDQ